MSILSTEYALRRCMYELMRLRTLENITVGDICAAAKIGKRTFYRHYPDKYALLEDTYVQMFYSKLNITDDLNIYEIYRRIIRQMYQERDFFSHAIASKEQNGFWDIIFHLLYPSAYDHLTHDLYIDRGKEYYIHKDTDIILYQIEEWFKRDCNETPDELVDNVIRLGSAIHGKWEYQTAMEKGTDEYSFEKFNSGQW